MGRNHFMSNLTLEKEKAFFEFIYKRQLIWYRRFVLQEDAPWTDDEILQKFKFINMYRELDRCTLYILETFKNIKDRRMLLLNIIFYRFFNLSGLYEMLEIEPFDHMDNQLLEQLDTRFKQLKKSGTAIFNNAYVISPGNSHAPKHFSILNNLMTLDKKLSGMIEKIDACETPETSFEILLEIPLAGPFLTCEIWTDLTYFGFFRQNWDDNDFVSIGPGAKWGLEILYGKMQRDQYFKQLYYLYKRQHSVLPRVHKDLKQKLSWKKIVYTEAYSSVPFLSITNMEGALCEFRKYWNLSHGKGRRRYYKGKCLEKV